VHFGRIDEYCAGAAQTPAPAGGDIMLIRGRTQRSANAKMGGPTIHPLPSTHVTSPRSDSAAPHSRWALSRGRRVTILLLGVIVLSIADLIVTLAFLRANWMMEANPIAEYIIRTTQSPIALILFKCLTVGVCAALLYRTRHFRSGEVAAWSAVAVLAVMCVMWRSYAKGLDETEIVLASANANCDDEWLGLP
jgi:hypothetical protein